MDACELDVKQTRCAVAHPDSSRSQARPLQIGFLTRALWCSTWACLDPCTAQVGGQMVGEKPQSYGVHFALAARQDCHFAS